MAGSGMNRAERQKMREKLNDAISSCNGALKKLAEEDEAESSNKGVQAIEYETQSRDVVRNVALKAGDGREGTRAGIVAARMLGQRGGPRE
jgi:hypothetical protein